MPGRKINSWFPFGDDGNEAEFSHRKLRLFDFDAFAIVFKPGTTNACKRIDFEPSLVRFVAGGEFAGVDV